MQYRFHGNAAHVETAQALVRRKARLLERRFANTADDLKMLDVALHYHDKTNSYRARLLFRGPTQQIAADGHADTLGYAIRRAFHDLYDQVDRYLADLQREPEIRRAQSEGLAEREARLREMKQGTIEQRSEDADVG